MTTDCVHVAVAAIVNKQNQVLISKRADHVHQGGLWEFPGGKIEIDETTEQALHREIKEELSIEISNPEPLIKIEHSYHDKSVVLEVFVIKEFTGEPVGAEGQAVKWENITNLKIGDFPEANKNIIAALKLPDFYMITGGFDSIDDFKIKLNNALSHGKRIVQLRCKDLQDSKDFQDLAHIAKSICAKNKTKLLVNSTVDEFNQLNTDGLHLNSRKLFEYKSRPVSYNKLLSVSCHNEAEMNQAKLLDADIILLSPVKATSSHPGVTGIGWEQFNNLAKDSICPVYALGGMNASDVEQSKKSGAQGIAAISSLWLYEE